MLADHLEALWDDDLTFQQFVHLTRDDWTRLARTIRKRWRIPPGVEFEDVRQEMLLAAWNAVGNWHEGNGMALAPFVVWKAVTRAKRWINGQRNAPRRSDRAASRYPVSFSVLMPADGDDVEAFAASLAYVYPNQEQHAEMREQALEAFGRCRTEREQVLLQLLLEEMGSVDHAIRRIVENPELRLALGLGGPNHSRRAIWRMVQQVALYDWRDSA